ncbi:hypothetical protein H6776_00260 [Candidatus Nomurabacteria bacterium]|nr:hypothetical protein [Candidatus Nomurabacteria bacterium]
MNTDPLSLIREYIQQHPESILPGSIEETSLHTAATLWQQGQIETARQIIGSLLIDEKHKQECLHVLEGQKDDTHILDKESERHTQDTQEKEGTPLPPVPVSPPPAPPSTPQPLITPPPAPDVSAITKPLPLPPTAPPQEPSQDMRMLADTDAQPPQEPEAAPAPPIHQSLDDLLAAHSSFSQQQEASPESLQIAIPSSSENTPADDMWERFNRIVKEEQEKEIPHTTPRLDDLSHTQRIEQLNGELGEAEEEVEEDQDKALTQDYDTVFGGSAHTSRYDVPGVIKTYAPAQSMVDKEEREHNAHREERMTTYKKYFDAAEQYLTRAVASGNSNIMTSAFNQFQSLKERYPEYVSQRSAHIADMQKIIDNYHHSRAEAIAHESYALTDESTVAPGMKITGDTDAYIITSIQQPTADHDAIIIFISDRTKQTYRIPAKELATALTDAALHTDEFFERYRDQGID